VSDSTIVTEVVVDCSVTMAWYFADEKCEYADAILEGMTGSLRIVVPSLWPLEVANVLVCAERRGRSTPSQAAAWLPLLEALPIVVDSQTGVRAWNDTLDLARLHSLSVYDAAYLELALRRGIPLATLDRKLSAASPKAGVALFTP
jgi:predicted nucleic acid-binding protein